MKRYAIWIGLVVTGLVLSPQLGWCKASGAGFEHHKVSGDRYLKAGEIASAIQEYQKAVAINPKSTATHFNLAIAYYLDKDMVGAISALEKIVELNPLDVEAQYNLACLWLYQKDLNKAKYHFEKAKACCDGLPRFASLTRQGLEYVNELHSIDSSTQALALFLLQFQQGMTPEPIAF
jgi:tetratricopeptide (TPR) repeat protein